MLAAAVKQIEHELDDDVVVDSDDEQRFKKWCNY